MASGRLVWWWVVAAWWLFALPPAPAPARAGASSLAGRRRTEEAHQLSAAAAAAAAAAAGDPTTDAILKEMQTYTSPPICKSAKQPCQEVYPCYQTCADGRKVPSRCHKVGTCDAPGDGTRCIWDAARSSFQPDQCAAPPSASSPSAAAPPAAASPSPSPSPSAGPGGSAPTIPGGTITVAGKPLNDKEATVVRWVAQKVVPFLKDAKDAPRARVAAAVTWWSLKEGVLDTPNPFVYSNCHGGQGDHRIGPFEACAGAVWQSGVAGIQVKDHPLDKAVQLGRSLYASGPGPVDQRRLLEITAADCGYAPGSAEFKQVAEATGVMAQAWLLRNGPIAFSLQFPTVDSECVKGSRAWCFSSSWDTSAKFAGTKAIALAVILDLTKLFGG